MNKNDIQGINGRSVIEGIENISFSPRGTEGKETLDVKNFQLIQENGTVLMDSRDVAGMIERRHADLLRDIKNYIGVLGKRKIALAEPKIGVSDFFQENSYNDAQGKPRTHFFLTKKGCEMVANKMTGEKGILFTAQYINAFHEMEERLKNKVVQLPPQVPVYTPYPEIDKADRLLHMLRQHQELVNQNVNDAVQSQVVELITGKPLPKPKKTKPDGLGTAAIANFLNVTTQKITSLVRKHQLKKPEYGIVYTYDFQGAPREIFLFNEAGKNRIIELLEGANKNERHE